MEKDIESVFDAENEKLIERVNTPSTSLEDVSFNIDKNKEQNVNREQLINEKLNPKIEKDNAGFERKIYTIGDISFTFKGKEELPVYSTLTNSNATFIGESPNWIERDDYKKYLQRLQISQSQIDKPKHYVVNKSVLGVINLAIKIGSQDPHLSQMGTDITKGIYSQRTLELIDALVAVNYDDFKKHKNDSSGNAEAVVVLSLVGDISAQRAVSEAKVAFEEAVHDKKVYIEKKDIDYKTLNLEGLVCAHATRYEPKKDEQGRFIINSTFDATKGKILRNTVHATLNHKVSSHMYGSWEDAGYVVISPFEKMMKTNGLPSVLNPVDTYWTTNPGEPVVFDGKLIAPGGKEIKCLYEEKDNIIKYKSEGFDINDLAYIYDYLQKNNKDDNFLDVVECAITKVFNTSGYFELWEQWDYEVTKKAINQFLYHQDDSFGVAPVLLKLLIADDSQENKSLNIESKIRSIIEQSGAYDGIKPGVEDKEKAITELVEMFADDIKSTIFARINEIVVQKTINKLGCSVVRGGMWGIDDKAITNQIETLSRQLNISKGFHFFTAERELATQLSYAIKKATQGEDKNNKFDWTKYFPDCNEFIGKLDAKSCRMLYASGLLTARG